jgi:3-methyl-2-oxobutanoate hydroxymethyltransferase
MSNDKTEAAESSAKSSAKPGTKPAVDGKREKRSITEIRESKKTGEKMVYMSVPDYTSAQWAEMAGVDVAVLGDSLAMIAHGHRNTIPATMDMMVLHGQAVRRGAPNTFVLGCMPYQSYNTIDRALQNATRFMQDSLCDAVKPQGGKSQAHILKALVDSGIPTASHIGLTPHTVAMFGGFKIQGRTADAAMKILEDALAIEDAGCFMLEFEAVPAKIAKLISEDRHWRRRRDRWSNSTLLRFARRLHGLQAEVYQALRQAHRSRGRRHQAIRQGSEGGDVPRRRSFLWRQRCRI